MAETNQHLADIYEKLKQHESALLDLLLDAEALKSVLSDDQRGKFQAAREKLFQPPWPEVPGPLPLLTAWE